MNQQDFKIIHPSLGLFTKLFFTVGGLCLAKMGHTHAPMGAAKVMAYGVLSFVAATGYELVLIGNEKTAAKINMLENLKHQRDMAKK